MPRAATPANAPCAASRGRCRAAELAEMVNRLVAFANHQGHARSMSAIPSCAISSLENIAGLAVLTVTIGAQQGNC
jgi:hypothetical protein